LALTTTRSGKAAKPIGGASLGRVATIDLGGIELVRSGGSLAHDFVFDRRVDRNGGG
jgi:hypothetical protein